MHHCGSPGEGRPWGSHPESPAPGRCCLGSLCPRHSSCPGGRRTWGVQCIQKVPPLAGPREGFLSYHVPETDQMVSYHGCSCQLTQCIPIIFKTLSVIFGNFIITYREPFTGPSSFASVMT